MSNVSGVAGTSGAAMYGVSASTNVMLSPESLIYFCATQLRALDGQITKRVVEQQNAREAQGTLGQLQDLYNHLKPTGVGQDDAATKQRILQYYKEAYDKAPPGQRDRIQESFNAFRKSACYNDSDKAYVSLANYDAKQIDADIKNCNDADNHNFTSGDEVDLRLKEINGIVDDVNKGAELEMTNLQTLVSQRQMAVQLTTNLISKVNESMQSIVANTGK